VTAIFSEDRTHRFILARGPAVAPYVLFIGLNSSDADEEAEDPTTGRLNSFTQSWQFVHWQIANLSAFISSDPRRLRNRPQDVGIVAQENWYLSRAIEGATLIVPCWGAGVRHFGKVQAVRRPQQVLALCSGHEHKLRCFGRTKDGHPKHPLYLLKSTPLQYWSDLA
jgi:hypothetical protein